MKTPERLTNGSDPDANQEYRRYYDWFVATRAYREERILRALGLSGTLTRLNLSAANEQFKLTLAEPSRGDLENGEDAMDLSRDYGTALGNMLCRERPPARWEFYDPPSPIDIYRWRPVISGLGKGIYEPVATVKAEAYKVLLGEQWRLPEIVDFWLTKANDDRIA